MNPKEYKEKNVIQSILYYLSVWVTVLQKSLSKSVAYRFELISKFLRTLLILGTQLILVKSLYAGTRSVAGWSVEEYYLLLGVFNFVNYISWGVFNVNLWRLEERVVKGEFDFFLLYPTGSIFTSAFIEFFLDDAIASVSGVVLIAYYLIYNWTSITLGAAVGFILVVLFAFITWFALHLAIAAFNFIILKNGLLDFLKSVSRIGSFPPDIFSQNGKIILFTLFPIAFIAAVPTRVLAGIYSWEFLIYAFMAAMTSFFFAASFWHYAIRGYTSNGG